MDEINEAVVLVKKERGIEIPPAVYVIPVRMQEAWLLFDETSIRYAAGNRNGRTSLNLPLLRHLESIPDPKSVLHENIKLASGLTGRRIKRFRVNQYARRVSEFTEDFSPLRVLTAFAALEADVKRVIEEQGWRG